VFGGETNSESATSIAAAAITVTKPDLADSPDFLAQRSSIQENSTVPFGLPMWQTDSASSELESHLRRASFETSSFMSRPRNRIGPVSGSLINTGKAAIISKPRKCSRPIHNKIEGTSKCDSRSDYI